MSPELRRSLGLLVVLLVAVIGAIVLLRGPADDPSADPSVEAVAGTADDRIAVLRERLGELRVAQDTFHRHWGIYGRSVGQMRFAVPPGMTIEIIAHSTEGWAAQGTVRGSERMCAIFVGDSARWAFTPAARSGEPACSP
ncbi:MAG TPA: hypothetical protein VMM18_10490 [Gemmatimonadaceae bacterium]|nr:hypothetical protein [Gemmatimonadaceae bacterium]